MKKLCLFSIISFVLVSTTVYSAERALLGNGNIAVKLDYIAFTDNHWSGQGDDGLYVGLEGYGEIIPNLYIGGEIGNGVNVSILGDDINFVPIELNLKYAIEVAPNLVIDFGAGASYNYTEISIQHLFSADTEEDDWLFGGQIFADLTYKMKRFFMGINGKYQITEDFKNENFDFNNWRLGVQIGMMF